MSRSTVKLPVSPLDRAHSVPTVVRRRTAVISGCTYEFAHGPPTSGWPWPGPSDIGRWTVIAGAAMVHSKFRRRPSYLREIRHSPFLDHSVAGERAQARASCGAPRPGQL